MLRRGKRFIEACHVVRPDADVIGITLALDDLGVDLGADVLDLAGVGHEGPIHDRADVTNE